MVTTIGSMTGVTISSAYFSSTTSLELFPEHLKLHKCKRVALVYGKNGSGKSTIAQGFREYRDAANPRTVTLEPMKGTLRLGAASTATPEKILVFDEEYVSSRVKVKGSGLDAIVLFGEQVAIEDQIAEAEKLIEAMVAEVSNQETACVRFTNKSDVNSPDYWLAQIHSRLREANGWADVGSTIKGQRQNLSVTDAEIERIGKMPSTRSPADLHGELSRRLPQYLAVSAASTPIATGVALVPAVNDAIERARLLLDKVVERPQLTDREQSLLDLFGVTVITSARALLSDPKHTVCDKCLQPIRDEYRVEALGRIERVLNRDVDEFTGELERLLIPEAVTGTYQVYRDLQSCGCVLERLSDYNTAVAAHNDAVTAKINSPFGKMVYDDSIGVAAAHDALNRALDSLEADRVSFNRTLSERAAVKNELLVLNDEIAHWTIESMYASLQKQRSAKQIADDQLRQMRASLAELERKRTFLDSQRRNLHIAAEEINRSLDYVFFCRGRLSLELGSDGVYHLRANGQPISPNKVSCGERNVIALCYFFAEAAKDMDVKAAYSDEMLLVIDDPVSSFDLENRIGILSFLRWKLEQVLVGCPTSKVLIMTHDLSVMFDMAKMLGEVKKRCEQTAVNMEYCLFQLDGRSLSGFQHEKHNEYTQLLHRVYQYAAGTAADPDSDLVIGNMMRRVLEAFASFSFKKGVVAVSLDERVLALLPDDESRMYYRNLMYRFVLNGESHFMESIQGAPEMSFFGHLSSDEKKRTAKDILCFMYRLNKAHVLSHLPDAEPDLIAWCVSVSGMPVKLAASC